MIVKFKKINPEATIPRYAHVDDAGMDITTVEEKTIAPAERHLFSTGICMELPNDFVALIWDRSGLAVRAGVKTMAGVIDSGYRGEIKIALINLSQEPIVIQKNERIAQMLIQPVAHAHIEEVDKLTESIRGSGGFGSTGK